MADRGDPADQGGNGEEPGARDPEDHCQGKGRHSET